MKKEEESCLVVDAGNTSVKVARFKKNELVRLERFSSDQRVALHEYLSSFKSDQSILASVLEDSEKKMLINTLNPTVILTTETSLPIDLSSYKSPKTLGVDRIANAVAGYHFSGKKNALIIDIGTCVKFDFINAKGIYQGGSISPGLAMRYKSLAHFTGQLPELNGIQKVDFMGDSTNNCIYSGVINGLTAEITSFLRHYNQRFNQLTIFLTGGEHKYFDKAFKNSIFVDENLTLKGLKLILDHNEV